MRSLAHHDTKIGTCPTPLGAPVAAIRGSQRQDAMAAYHTQVRILSSCVSVSTRWNLVFTPGSSFDFDVRELPVSYSIMLHTFRYTLPSIYPMSVASIALHIPHGGQSAVSHPGKVTGKSRVVQTIMGLSQTMFLSEKTFLFREFPTRFPFQNEASFAAE